MGVNMGSGGNQKENKSRQQNIDRKQYLFKIDRFHGWILNQEGGAFKSSLMTISSAPPVSTE